MSLNTSQQSILAHVYSLRRTHGEGGEGATYNIGVDLHLTPGALPDEACEQLVAACIADHPRLATALQDDQAETARLVPLNDLPSLVFADAVDQEEEDLHVQLAKEASFSLTPGQPLVRFLFVRRAASSPSSPAAEAGASASSSGPAFTRLVVVFHHLVADGYSLSKLICPTLMRHLNAIAAAGHGKGAMAGAAPGTNMNGVFPPADDKSREAPSVSPESVQYWMKHLPSETVAPLDFPLLEGPLPASTGTGITFDHAQHGIDASLWSEVREAHRKHGVTNFTWMFGAMWAVWSQYTGRTDFGLGAAFAGRASTDMAATDSFAKVFPLYPHLAASSATSSTPVSVGDMSWAAFLQHIQAMIKSAKAHEHVSATDLAGERPLVAQISLAVTDELEATSAAVARANIFSSGSPSDLAVYLRFSRRGTPQESVAVQYVWRRDALAHEVIAQFHENWLAFMADACAAVHLPQQAPVAADGAGDKGSSVAGVTTVVPKTSWRRINWLASTQRHQVLHLNNPAYEPGLVEKLATDASRFTLHGMFRASARAYPDCVAVVESETRQATYAQLDRASDLFATRYLAGVAPQARVALFMVRSLLTMQAMLAIMKRGAVYVPVDTALPVARVHYILQQSRADLIICNTSSKVLNEQLRGLLAGTATQICELPDEPIVPEEDEESEFPLATATDASAYIIFTSGTTGVPKGVEIKHRGACNSIRYHDTLVPHTPSDAVLQSASLSFDMSIGQAFNAWRCGARLVLLMEVGEWHNTVVRYGVTVVQGPASVIASAFDADCMPACLRQVQIGGEPVALTLLHRMIQANPHIQFANLYGPTEASMYTNMTCVRLEDTYVPMGPPITNQRAYILNDLLQLVPAGVPGRIFMGALSPGVGYFGREDLTREKFVPDPFACEFPPLPGVAEIMYDSGDIARWKNGGNVECLGRRDQQVKWHGLRIELGEIESHLMTCPDVSIKASAARLCPLTATSVSSANNAPEVRQSGGETHVLVGYVVPQRGDERPIDDAGKARLLNWLAQHVPKYMVPSIIMVIDELPMSANGKLARERLPVPTAPAAKSNAESEPSSSAAPAAPVVLPFQMSSHEQKLWKAWNVALDMPAAASTQVASREAMQALNFFDQSGTSLAVMRLLRLVRTEFPGCTVSVADIYRKPNFGDLLALLRARLHRRVSSIDISAIQARNASLKKTASQTEASQKSSIAIVGMAGVFPGAKDVSAFWDLICNGEVATRKLSGERGDACGRLSTDMFEFDAGAFGLKPDEATLMDPQHRLALQQTLHALEDARIDTTGLVKGVFVSGSDSGYYSHLVQPYLATGANGADQMRTYTARINNGVDQMASRIAYHFNCTGPTAAVQTACSSSLSCLSVAVDALQLGRCDVAIVTAASLRMPGHDGYVFQPGMIFSEAGQCRPFEARSDGTVPGNAVVSLILVRQELAERLSAPRTYAAIDAVAFGNNGRDAARGHATFSTPTIQGQVQVLTRALREAKIYDRRAELVHYVETHGTGTAVGDAVEWASLQNVLGKKPAPPEGAAGATVAPTPLDTVYVGGVKANIGHTDAASGLAGLVKCALVLFHSHIPPQPEFQRMHENLDAEGRLVVPTKAQPLFSDGADGFFQADDAYACVQSIGMGGTNASAVLHRVRRPMMLSSGGGGENGDGTWYRSPIVFFRVRTQKQAHAFVAHLQQLQQDPKRHRSHHTADVELRVWARESMERYLTAAHPIVTPSSSSSAPPAYLRCVMTRDSTMPLLVQDSAASSSSVLDRIVLFGGQGAFEWNKLRGAFYAFRPAREPMRLCFKWLDFLSTEQTCKPPQFLNMLEDDSLTSLQQPQQPSAEQLETWSPVLNFILQYGMWQLWAPHVERSAASGGQTTALGHSLGEVMAACVTGHLTWREGIQILYHRIALFDEFGQQGRGRMAVVRASADETLALLAAANATDLHVACYNTPTQTVVCGPRAAIESLQASHPRQVRLVPNVGVAYHMPEGAFGAEMKRAWHERWLIASRSKRVRVEEAQAAENKQAGASARIAFASCIDIDKDPSDLRSAAYWWKHLTNPVQYIEAVRRIAARTTRRIVSLEVGLDSIASRLWADNAPQVKDASGETMASNAAPQIFLHLPRVNSTSAGVATATVTFDASTVCEQLHVALGRAWIAGFELDREACLQLSAPNKYDEHRFVAPLPLSTWAAQRMLVGAPEETDATAQFNVNAKVQPVNAAVAAPRVVWTSEMRRQAIRDAFRATMVFAKKPTQSDNAEAGESDDAWLDLDVFEQGNDSLQVVTLIHRLTQLDLDVRTQHIYEHPTVRAFETWALEQVGTNRNQAEAPTFSLMMTPSAVAEATAIDAKKAEAADAPDTIVLLPTGGGTLHIYMSILDELKRLGCRARIIGLHRPDTFIPSVRALASYYVDRMVEALRGGQGRIFLVGGSYGGMLAFEMASQLGRARTGASGNTSNSKTALADRLAVAARLCGLSMFDTPSIRTHRFERTDLAAMVFWVLQNKYQLADEDLANLPTVEAIKTYVMETRACVKNEEEWRECLRFGQFFHEDIHNILTYDIAAAEQRDPSRELPPQRLFIACREPLAFDAHETWPDWRRALGPEARASEPAPGHHLSMYKDEGARAIARELLDMLDAK